MKTQPNKSNTEEINKHIVKAVDQLFRSEGGHRYTMCVSDLTSAYLLFIENMKEGDEMVMEPEYMSAILSHTGSLMKFVTEMHPWILQLRKEKRKEKLSVRHYKQVIES